MNARTLRALLLLAPVTILLDGCATTSEDFEDRGWQPETAEAIFARQPPPDRIRVVREDSTIVLEGARLETDSIIGFWEADDGRWKRVSLLAETATLEVR